jgi:hypothetical protein
MRRNIKRTAVVGGTVAALFGAGVAFAAWTNTGEGSGAVTAGQPEVLTVNVGPVSGLVPTKSVNVPFTVANPNPYGVKLTKAELVSVATTKTGCDAAEISGSDVALGAPTDVVASNGTSGSYNFPVTMSNLVTNACQGATFTVTLRVTGLSN